MTRFALLLAAVALLAQAPPPGPSPATQYHLGAQAFVDGDDARALAAVNAGLSAAPTDARLQALRDLIQQRQDEQDQQDGGEQDETADNQDPGEQGGEGDPEDGGQTPESPDEPDGPGAEPDQTRTPPPADPSSGDAPPPPAGGEPDEMTAAQAKRILDAVGGEERLLLREIRRAPTQLRRSDKDW